MFNVVYKFFDCGGGDCVSSSCWGAASSLVLMSSTSRLAQMLSSSMMFSICGFGFSLRVDALPAYLFLVLRQFQFVVNRVIIHDLERKDRGGFYSMSGLV